MEILIRTVIQRVQGASTKARTKTDADNTKT